jgi:hypothetical protein
MSRFLRLATLLLAICALVAGGPMVAAARQATPATSPLEALGLPGFTITATAQGFEAPAAVAAGWYLVTFVNRTGDGLTCDLMLLPEGETAGDILAAPPGPSLPAWAYETTFPGGPTSSTQQAAIQLTAGTWMIWTAGEAMPKPHILTVTPSTGPVTAPTAPADIDVAMQEYAFFGLEQPVPAGERLWKIENTGAQPHFMDVVRLPKGTTQQQLSEAIAAAIMGTPVVGGLDLDRVTGAGATATLSPGQTMWTVFDLEPGTYGVVCFFPDRESNAPHAAMGMVTVFTVE